MKNVYELASLMIKVAELIAPSQTKDLREHMDKTLNAPIGYHCNVHVTNQLADELTEDIIDNTCTFEQLEEYTLSDIVCTAEVWPDVAEKINEYLETYYKRKDETTPEEDYEDYITEKLAIEGPSEW